MELRISTEERNYLVPVYNEDGTVKEYGIKPECPETIRSILETKLEAFRIAGIKIPPNKKELLDYKMIRLREFREELKRKKLEEIINKHRTRY